MALREKGEMRVGGVEEKIEGVLVVYKFPVISSRRFRSFVHHGENIKRIELSISAKF